EVLEEVRAMWRVHDLRMELHAVEAPLRILEGRNGSRWGYRDDPRAGWRRGHRVAVRHPHRFLLGQPGEQRRLDCREIGLAELRGAGSFDCAAEIEREQLLAVTDAQRGDAEREDLGVDVRRSLRVHRCRAPA